MAEKAIKGVVQAVNDGGVKVDGTWYNYSKFGDGKRLSADDLGAEVELTLDKAGFVRSFKMIAPPARAGAKPTSSWNPRAYALNLAIQTLPYLQLDGEDRTEALIVELLTIAKQFALFLEDES